jgi:NifU-like protein involved in Fe-S cluster formation
VIEESLHREIIEEHARSPRYDNELYDHTHEGECQSIKTGNTCHIRIRIKNNKILGVGLSLQGSALANVGASLLFSEVVDVDVDQVKVLIIKLCKVLEFGDPLDLPGELCVYHSIRRFPERHDCALLAWRALSKALEC